MRTTPLRVQLAAVTALFALALSLGHVHGGQHGSHAPDHAQARVDRISEGAQADDRVGESFAHDAEPTRKPCHHGDCDTTSPKEPKFAAPSFAAALSSDDHHEGHSSQAAAVEEFCFVCRSHSDIELEATERTRVRVDTANADPALPAPLLLAERALFGERKPTRAPPSTIG